MRRLAFSFTAILIITGGTLMVVLFNSDPNSGSTVVLFAFFLCLYLVTWSFFSLICLLAQKLLKSFSPPSGIILRRTFELATVLTGSILFSSLGVFNTLSFISLIAIAILLELFFISKHKESIKV